MISPYAFWASDELSEEELVDRFRSGDVRALARAISLVERRDPSARRLEESLGEQARLPGVVGFTGAPGTGKSTLVDGLVALLRKQAASVAVLATDPNSPFTGGAILGDRIRMQRHALDPKVFIRSMGARGHLAASGSPRRSGRLTRTHQAASARKHHDAVCVLRDDDDLPFP